MSPQYDLTAENPAKVWARMRTAAISTTIGDGTGNVNIHTTTTGLFFVVFHVFFNTLNTCAVTLKSGTTPITGAIPMQATTDMEWISAGFPILKGRVSGEALQISASVATELRGFAVLCEIMG